MCRPDTQGQRYFYKLKMACKCDGNWLAKYNGSDSADFDYSQTATAAVATRARARWRKLSRAQIAHRKSEAPHGLRERRLPQRRRMLEPPHRDVHDPRQRLYAPLRLLRRAEGLSA